MASLIDVITKFQNVALIATGGAVAYWYIQNDHGQHSTLESSADDQREDRPASKTGHTLTGQVVDKDKQVGRVYTTLHLQVTRCHRVQL